MAVRHTEWGGITMLDRLLLARDRGTVVLSPELATADLLTSSWHVLSPELAEASLTHHYEVELILGDDGVVTLVPRRIGTRAVKEPLTLVAAVKGVWSDEDYTATICAHLELGGRNLEAYTQESVDKLGFFPAPMSLRNHLLEPEYLSNLVLRHIQRLIEEPHGRRTSWLQDMQTRGLSFS